MSRIREATDRAAGALHGAWDAARGTTYEPLEGRSGATSRERAVYKRWQRFKEPRNAYERDAYQSLPRELEAEMDRAYEIKCAARAAGDAEQDAKGQEAARASWENEQEAGS